LNRKSFGKAAGRSHFAELNTSNLASHNFSTWFVEVDAEVEISDLLDPAAWGPQKLIRRGDVLHAMRTDNAYFGLFVCTRVAAGFPTFEILSIRERQSSSASKRAAKGETRREYVLGAGLVDVRDGEIVAVTRDPAQIQAKLADDTGKPA